MIDPYRNLESFNFSPFHVYCGVHNYNPIIEPTSSLDAYHLCSIAAMSIRGLRYRISRLGFPLRLAVLSRKNTSFSQNVQAIGRTCTQTGTRYRRINLVMVHPRRGCWFPSILVGSFFFWPSSSQTTLDVFVHLVFPASLFLGLFQARNT